MSTFDVNPPYSTGEPLRTTWVNAMPASASAFCCTRAPASVIGAIAPASVNGVITIIWLRADIWMMPSSIGWSYRSGDDALMIDKMLGSRSNVSWSTPRAMRAISMPSRLRWRPSE